MEEAPSITDLQHMPSDTYARTWCHAKVLICTSHQGAKSHVWCGVCSSALVNPCRHGKWRIKDIPDRHAKLNRMEAFRHFLFSDTSAQRKYTWRGQKVRVWSWKGQPFRKLRPSLKDNAVVFFPSFRTPLTVFVRKKRRNYVSVLHFQKASNSGTEYHRGGIFHVF